MNAIYSVFHWLCTLYMKVKGNLMKKTYQITEKGKGDLEVELADLKSRRGEIAEKIAVARDLLTQWSGRWKLILWRVRFLTNRQLARS